MNTSICKCSLALVWVELCVVSDVNCCLSITSYHSIQKGQEMEELTALTKKGKCACLAMDTENEVIGYCVPLFRARWVMKLQADELNVLLVMMVVMKMVFMLFSKRVVVLYSACTVHSRQRKPLLLWPLHLGQARDWSGWQSRLELSSLISLGSFKKPSTEPLSSYSPGHIL